MDHLRAGIGLLHIVRHGHRVELADRVVAFEYATGIFPRDRRSGLDLRPGNLRVVAAAMAALGDEVKDAALAFLVAGIPVLDGGIFNLRILMGNQLDHRRVQLVFVALRRGASFEIADVRAFVGNQQRPFELPGVGRIDAEVGGKLHRATNTLRNIAKRAVGKDG